MGRSKFRPNQDDEWSKDGDGFEKVADPALSLFALPEPWGPHLGPSTTPEQLLDTVVSLEHDVPLSDDLTLRLHEHCSLRCWFQQPRRGVLFLGGTAMTADAWAIPVDGYHGPQMAAQRGMFAFSIDFLGVGDHYQPGGDALESTFERNQEALKTVLRYLRYFRAIPKLDLIGESWGGAHATQLATDTERVRSCSLSSMTYKMGNPAFLSDEFVGFLKSFEDNYLPGLDPAMFAALTAGAPAEVADYLRRTQTGPFLTSQLWQFIKGLPHFDPAVARVPGLVISGSLEAPDGQALVADYGGGAEFSEIAEAGHAPRLQSPEIASSYWNRVFEFLDSLSKADE